MEDRLSQKNAARGFAGSGVREFAGSPRRPASAKATAVRRRLREGGSASAMGREDGGCLEPVAIGNRGVPRNERTGLDGVWDARLRRRCSPLPDGDMAGDPHL